MDKDNIIAKEERVAKAKEQIVQLTTRIAVTEREELKKTTQNQFNRVFNEFFAPSHKFLKGTLPQVVVDFWLNPLVAEEINTCKKDILKINSVTERNERYDEMKSQLVRLLSETTEEDDIYRVLACSSQDFIVYCREIKEFRQLCMHGSTKSQNFNRFRATALNLQEVGVSSVYDEIILELFLRYGEKMRGIYAPKGFYDDLVILLNIKVKDWEKHNVKSVASKVCVSYYQLSRHYKKWQKKQKGSDNVKIARKH